MKMILPCLVFAMIALPPIASVQAATPPGMKLCLNSKTNGLVSRVRCRRNEKALSLVTLADRVVKREYVEEFSESFDSDVTIPAGTTDPFIGIISGTLARTASCSSGIVYASSCESQSLTGLQVGATPSSDGKSVQCSWSNSSLESKVGRYYARVVCGER